MTSVSVCRAILAQTGSRIAIATIEIEYGIFPFDIKRNLSVIDQHLWRLFNSLGGNLIKIVQK